MKANKMMSSARRGYKCIGIAPEWIDRSVVPNRSLCFARPEMKSQNEFL